MDGRLVADWFVLCGMLMSLKLGFWQWSLNIQDDCLTWACYQNENILLRHWFCFIDEVDYTSLKSCLRIWEQLKLHSTQAFSLHSKELYHVIQKELPWTGLRRSKSVLTTLRCWRGVWEVATPINCGCFQLLLIPTNVIYLFLSAEIPPKSL